MFQSPPGWYIELPQFVQQHRSSADAVGAGRRLEFCGRFWAKGDRDVTASGAERVSTGVTGLDDVLHGGLTRDRLYLMEGMPGSGKTTLAFQFLLDGAKHGEPVLYLTLSETEEEIRAVAASHGWSLDGVAILEVM